MHYLENKVGVADFAKSPWGLKLYQSSGFCKIYYSHFIFVFWGNNILEQNSKSL